MTGLIERSGRNLQTLLLLLDSLEEAVNFSLGVHWGHLNIRIFTHTKHQQVLDFLHVAGRAFIACSAALAQRANYLISFIVRCR